MGHIYATVRVSRDAEGPSQDVSVLVDTGATASVIPRRILVSLGIRPLRREAFELADGRTIVREVGGAYVSFAGRTSPTLVVFGEEDDTPVLGVLALEELGLEIDPRSGDVRSAKRLLAGVRVPELATS